MGASLSEAGKERAKRELKDRAARIAGQKKAVSDAFVRKFNCRAPSKVTWPEEVWAGKL